MSAVTKPVALDETLQRIADVLEGESNNWRLGIRRKSLGSVFTAAQASALANDDMSDFWNGDYWTINNIKWVIVDNSGSWRKSSGFGDTPSLIIMPETNLISAEAYLIDNANDSGHGYRNCAYRTRTDGKGRAACRTIVNNAFGSSHVATHNELMSNGRSSSGASGWAWCSTTDVDVPVPDVELPSEANIYGHGIMGSSALGGAGGYNEGLNYRQFMLFKLSPKDAINGQNYWLRDIVSASGFAFVFGDGYAGVTAPSGTFVGLRPYFILI